MVIPSRETEHAGCESETITLAERVSREYRPTKNAGSRIEPIQPGWGETKSNSEKLSPREVILKGKER